MLIRQSKRKQLKRERIDALKWKGSNVWEESLPCTIRVLGNEEGSFQHGINECVRDGGQAADQVYSKREKHWTYK